MGRTAVISLVNREDLELRAQFPRHAPPVFERTEESMKNHQRTPITKNFKVQGHQQSYADVKACWYTCSVCSAVCDQSNRAACVRPVARKRSRTDGFRAKASSSV